jgi:cell division protein ZapA (FtsZ GTPase activity inhibitor)
MRTDLRLVYSELEKVSERISDYYRAIEEVEIAVEDMRSFLEEQESEAITKLKEKLDSVTIDMADKKSMLEALGNILDDYIADMRELVREAVSGNQTRVDTLDVSYNLWQMKNAYQSLEQATAFPVSSESFWQFGDEEEAEEEKRKRERNYQKLENFRINQLAGLKTRMKNRLDGIDDIYKKYLKAFETMDDSYRKRLDEIYNEKTSSQDKRKNFWENFGNISKAFLKAFAVVAAGAVLLALLPAWAPLVMLGGVALTGIGCMVMAEVPKEYVPEWMSGIKDTSDGVSKKLKGYLKRPEGMIEDIGQGLMDTVQTPEGIASVSGTVSGMLLGNWAGKMIKPQVYAQVGKTKENVVKWWNNARNNVRTAGNGGRGFQVKPAPKVKESALSSEGVSGADSLKIDSPKPTKPEQLHHYATNKNKTYTPQFDEITQKYGLDLDDVWNKELLPHQGRHPNAYHDYVLENMKQFDNIAQGDKDIFLKLYDGIKNNIKANPDMLYKDYWLNK